MSNKIKKKMSTGLVLFDYPIDRIEFNGYNIGFYTNNGELVCTVENKYCLDNSDYLFYIHDIAGFINAAYYDYLRKD